MTNSHAKTVVFSLTANIPMIHVDPSNGRSKIIPFIIFLYKRHIILRKDHKLFTWQLNGSFVYSCLNDSFLLLSGVSFLHKVISQYIWAQSPRLQNWPVEWVSLLNGKWSTIVAYTNDCYYWPYKAPYYSIFGAQPAPEVSQMSYINFVYQSYKVSAVYSLNFTPNVTTTGMMGRPHPIIKYSHHLLVKVKILKQVMYYVLLKQWK